MTKGKLVKLVPKLIIVINYNDVDLVQCHNIGR